MKLAFNGKDIFKVKFGKEVEEKVVFSGEIDYDLFTGEVKLNEFEIDLLIEKPLKAEFASVIESEINMVFKSRMIELLMCCPSSVPEVLEDEIEVVYMLPKTTEILLKGDEATIEPLTKIEKAMIELKKNGFFVFEENERLFLKTFSGKYSAIVQLSEEEIELRAHQYNESCKKKENKCVIY